MRSGILVFSVIAFAFFAAPSLLWADVWINEFHYSNVGGDVGEFFEIAGPAGTNLTGWKVYGYRDSGTIYKTVTLSDTIPDQQNGMGTLDFAMSSMQNGPADGLALADAAGGLIQLISYEGTLVGSEGPAQGVTSIDVGVEESDSTTPVGYSLQLGGNGYKAWPHPGHFYWQAPLTETPGAVNTNQTFDPTAVELVFFAATGYGNHASLRWQTATEIGTAGFHIWRADGGSTDFERITDTLIPSEGGASWGADYDHPDVTVIAGTPYVYVLEEIEFSGKSIFLDLTEVDWSSMLLTDVTEVAASSGGVVQFALDGGILNAGRKYGLLGSMSGTDPGTPLPGGHAVLPLNLDRFTRFLVHSAGAPWCSDFFGSLDSAGLAPAVLDIPAAPGLAGLRFDFAFGLSVPWDAASNAASIEMVP